MSDDPTGSLWWVAADLRPVSCGPRLSLAARLDAARAGLLFVEAGLVKGLPRAGGRGRLPVKVRDELLLVAVRNALGLMDGDE